MLEIEIFGLLEEAYEESFLDAILLIKRNEKKYKKSDFYKETRIPFLQLFKMYYENKKSERALIEQLDFWLENLDESVIEEKIANLLIKLKGDEDLKEIFSSFSVEGLEKEREELEKNLKDLKE